MTDGDDERKDPQLPDRIRVWLEGEQAAQAERLRVSGRKQRMLALGRRDTSEEDEP